MHAKYANLMLNEKKQVLYDTMLEQLLLMLQLKLNINKDLFSGIFKQNNIFKCEATLQVSLNLFVTQFLTLNP